MKTFLKRGLRLTSLAVAAFAVAKAAPADQAGPLNVVILYADDWRHDTLGCAGNPVVLTPRLDALAREGLRSRLLLQVHDELVLEVAPGEVDAVAQLVRREMTTAYDLQVPLEVSIGTGRTWAEAGH